MSLDDPDFAAREALRLIGPAPENWVPARPGVDHDVLVVGGGQSGSTFAFALARAGIRRVSVIDAAPEASQAGVWTTRARMKRLRTPKILPGPELGIPALSFQAWYEARHGREAYAAFDRADRHDWADYLAWYRRILGLDIRYGTRLLRIAPADGLLRVDLAGPDGPRTETVRKVILGTGVDGFGAPAIPAFAAALPRESWSHTSDAIDFAALAGKDVAIVGGAASAFDAAATALEAGARSVRLFVRRAELASTPIGRTKGYPGAYDNYAELPDALRWRQALRFKRWGSTPPPDAVTRATAFADFHLHLASPWNEVWREGERVAVSVAGETFAFDHVIFGTGYRADPASRPELAGFAELIARWGDRYRPTADEADEGLADHPYLGAGHELLEREPGTAPWLGDIHVFNPGGFVSFGLPIGDVPSLKRDVPAIVRRISRDLFFADLEHHRARIEGGIAAEFGPELYDRSVWRGRPTIAAE